MKLFTLILDKLQQHKQLNFPKKLCSSRNKLISEKKEKKLKFLINENFLKLQKYLSKELIKFSITNF